MKGWNESNVKAYYSYIKNTAVALGANRSLAEMEAQEIVNFEIALAKVRLNIYFLKLPTQIPSLLDNFIQRITS